MSRLRPRRHPTGRRLQQPRPAAPSAGDADLVDDCAACRGRARDGLRLATAAPPSADRHVVFAGDLARHHAGRWSSGPTPRRADAARRGRGREPPISTGYARRRWPSPGSWAPVRCRRRGDDAGRSALLVAPTSRPRLSDARRPVTIVVVGGTRRPASSVSPRPSRSHADGEIVRRSFEPVPDDGRGRRPRRATDDASDRRRRCAIASVRDGTGFVGAAGHVHADARTSVPAGSSTLARPAAGAPARARRRRGARATRRTLCSRPACRPTIVDVHGRCGPGDLPAADGGERGAGDRRWPRVLPIRRLLRHRRRSAGTPATASSAQARAVPRSARAASAARRAVRRRALRDSRRLTAGHARRAASWSSPRRGPRFAQAWHATRKSSASYPLTDGVAVVPGPRPDRHRSSVLDARTGSTLDRRAPMGDRRPRATDGSSELDDDGAVLLADRVDADRRRHRWSRRRRTTGRRTGAAGRPAR